MEEEQHISFLMLFPPTVFLEWSLDEHGFWQATLISLQV